MLIAFTPVNAQSVSNLEDEIGVKSLLNKAKKHYGKGSIDGDVVHFQKNGFLGLFKKSHYVGFIVKSTNEEDGQQYAISRALQHSDIIQGSSVHFGKRVNVATGCKSYLGEILHSRHKKEDFTMLVCKM